MSVALVTTLYGSLIANWLCSPIAGKLSVNNDLEVVNRQITIEGLLSIQAGENPRVIEEKLKSFLFLLCHYSSPPPPFSRTPSLTDGERNDFNFSSITRGFSPA